MIWGRQFVLPQLVWWLTPAGLVFGLLMPLLLLIASMLELNLGTMTVRGINFLSPEFLWLGLMLLTVAGVSAWIGQQIVPAGNGGYSVPRLDFGAMILGGIIVAAYLFWYKEYLLNPILLVSVLGGGLRPTRESMEAVTGITSLVNAGPAFISYYLWRLRSVEVAPLDRRMKGVFWTIVLFTIFRVYAWSERLALIEAMVPIVMALGYWVSGRGSARQKTMGVLMPVFGVPLLVLYFGVAEYFRSWSSATYNGKGDFWEFAIGRLASYYYTSLNNGAGLLQTGIWPDGSLHFVLSMMHAAPFGLGRVFGALVGSSESSFRAFLMKYGDLEFNNPSGLYTVVYDLGIPGAVTYFIVFGFISGILANRYAAGRLSGALLYPMFFISFLEVFRYPYLGTSRALVWALGIVLIGSFSGKALKRRRTQRIDG